ncbi:acyl-CoA thioesterase [Roseiconus nitratireducens]|uniref:Acyl-CoA thioesterase n=1 Tax=Roseiconus nitratireducens TaxID=2605748 RepID=A0A5M6CZA4_9BACT|nr:thioesterase family protein [Roseiconus nitratireducens]KAA5539342.1 acyl-CoA thioesterase [Roseiconus nitratireducens]
MSFRTRRRVEFRDTDAAGIVHFSVFFPWMESAEHEMLRSVGIDVLPPHPDPSDPAAAPDYQHRPITWPRVRAACDYTAAARFEDWIEVDARVQRIGRSSVEYAFRFSRQQRDGQAQAVAEGSIVTVCCRLHPGGGLDKVAIPQDIREKLATLQ